MLIHAVVFCATNTATTGPRCGVIEADIRAEDAAQWLTDTLAEHAWTSDGDGNTYCPLHNPADTGAFVDLVPGEYRPLGDSGWEARLPEKYAVSSTYTAQVEIRQRRGGDDD